MSQLKYVVGIAVQEYSDVTVAVCFHEDLIHSCFRRIFSKILGAGFFYIDDNNKVQVYGKSESLGIESRPEDVEFISKSLGLNS